MDPHTGSNDLDLERKVTEKLAGIPGMDTSKIEPHAEGTRVVLEGSVDNVFSARKAVLGAETVEGVHDVRSELQLTGETGTSNH